MVITSATAVAPLQRSHAVASPGGGFGAALRQHLARSVPASPTAANPVATTLAGLDRARERLDAALAAARRGRTFTAQELLALQADACRYSQSVEVASKVVEQAVQSVKQAVNTQV